MARFAVGDLAGLDIGLGHTQAKAATRHPAEQRADNPNKICEAGNFGQKTRQRLLHLWKPAHAVGCQTPRCPDIIAANAPERGITTA